MVSLDSPYPVLTLAVGLVGTGIFQALAMERHWRDDVVATWDLRSAAGRLVEGSLLVETTDLQDGAGAVGSVTFWHTDEGGIQRSVYYGHALYAPAAGDGARSDVPPDVEGELYEGTVRLAVEGANDMAAVMRFVEQLRRQPEFRMLRLIGKRGGAGVDICSGLRQPVSLKLMMLQMDGVSLVIAPSRPGLGDDEAPLEVRLA